MGVGKSVVIGRVAVKVLPDTTDFGDDLRADLNRIERNLKAIGVDLRLNEGLQQEVERAVEVAQRSAKAINIAVNLDDTDSIKRGLARIDAELEKLGETYKVEVHLDEASLKVEKARLEAALQASSVDIRIEIDPHDIETYRTALKKIDAELARQRTVEIDVNNGAESLHHTREQLKDLVDDYDGKKVELQVALDHGKASAELAIINRRRYVDLVVRVNQKSLAKAGTAIAALSGGRMLWDVTTNFTDWLSNIDKAIPKLSALALGIAGVAGWGLSAASNLFALSSSLAQIGPALLGLPGILGGMAIGLGASIAVLKDFNVVLPEVKKALGHLQDAMSSTFWSEAKKPFRDLIDSLLPELSAGLIHTSKQLGGWFGALADALGGGLNGALAGMFADLGESINIASGGMTGMVTIIEILGRQGASLLPRLAGWFVQITDRFAAFLDRTEQSGELQTWINNGIAALVELGHVFSELYGTLSGLGRAAKEAGGSTLGMMADTLERVHAAVDSPAFQTGMVTALTAAHDAMYAIGNISGPAFSNLFATLADTFDKVMESAGPAIGTLLRDIANALAAPAMQDSVVSLFDNLLVAIDALTPMWKPLGEIMGAVLTLIGDLAAAFAPLITSFVEAVAPAFVILVDGLTPVIELLSTGLADAIKAIAPSLPGLVDAFVNLALALAGPVAEILPVVGQAIADLALALTPVIDAIGPLLVPMVKMLADAIIELLPQIVDLWSALADDLGPLLPVIADCFAQIFKATSPDLIEALGEIIGKVAENADVFVELAGTATDLLVELTPIIVEAMPLLIELFEYIVTPMIELVRVIVEQVNPKLQAIAAFIGAVSDQVVAVIAWFKQMKADVETAVSGVQTKIEGLRKDIEKAVSNIGTWLIASGRSLIDGFTAGISDRADEAKKSVSNVLSDIRDLFPFSPAKEGPFSGKGWVLYSGMSIGDAMADGIEARAQNAVNAAKKMAADTHAALDEAEFMGPVLKQQVINYNAAEGSSLGSEEDLFAALSRGRAVGF